ncbi:MAG: hypothetical protein LBS81_04270 [Endomicrobium sp.]|jgi:hypothetical protein|nr:hypothetical protein [Endomicrobium sp.]
MREEEEMVRYSPKETEAGYISKRYSSGGKEQAVTRYFYNEKKGEV